MTTETVNPQPLPISASEEHTWAMLAHLSILINLFTGVLGPVAALIIYLMFAHRSRYIAYHAMQSFLFQLIVWYGLGILWGITGLLSALVIGIVLIPLACLLTPLFLLGIVIAPIYGVLGAVQTAQGQDFQYLWIGKWIRGMATGV